MARMASDFFRLWIRLTAEVIGICLLFAVANGRFEFSATNWLCLAFLWLVYSGIEAVKITPGYTKSDFTVQVILAIVSVSLVWCIVVNLQNYQTVWSTLLNFSVITLSGIGLGTLLKTQRITVKQLKKLNLTQMISESILIGFLIGTFVYGWRSDKEWFTASEFMVFGYTAMLITVAWIYFLYHDSIREIERSITRKIPRIMVFLIMILMFLPFIFVRSCFDNSVFYLEYAREWTLIWLLWLLIIVTIFLSMRHKN